MDGSSGKVLKQSFQDEGITLEEFIEKSKSIELLKLLSTPDLKYIYKNIGLSEYPADEHILMRWEKGYSIFILFSGTAAEYLIGDDGSPKYSTKFREGELLGKSAYKDKSGRESSIVTTSPSTAIELKISYLKVVAGTNRELHDFLAGEEKGTGNEEENFYLDASGKATRACRIELNGEAKFHLEGTKVDGIEAQFGIVKNLSNKGCVVDMDGDLFLEYEKGLLSRKVPINIRIEGMEKPILAVGRAVWFNQSTGLDVYSFRYRFGLHFLKFLSDSEELESFYERKKLELKGESSG